jgi:hypothetical protein
MQAALALLPGHNITELAPHLDACIAEAGD